MTKANCPKLVKNSIILAIALLFFVPNIANAATDSTINFQGKIVRNDTGYEGLNVTAGKPACVIEGSGNDTL
jgi:type 1 fimbria pilin